MPPLQQLPSRPGQDPSHMLPEHQERSSVGPVIGAFIVIALLAFGALYFWGAHLNQQNEQNPLPFIPEENSTTTTG